MKITFEFEVKCTAPIDFEEFDKMANIINKLKEFDFVEEVYIKTEERVGCKTNA